MVLREEAVSVYQVLKILNIRFWVISFLVTSIDKKMVVAIVRFLNFWY
jgi:hypothetical protein